MKFQTLALAAAGCLLAAPSFAGTSFSIHIGLPGICYTPAPYIYCPPPTLSPCEPEYCYYPTYGNYTYSYYPYSYTYWSYDYYRPRYRVDYRYDNRHDSHNDRDWDRGRDRDHRGGDWDRRDDRRDDRFDNHDRDGGNSHRESNNYRNERTDNRNEWNRGSQPVYTVQDKVEYDKTHPVASPKVQTIDSLQNNRQGRVSRVESRENGNAQAVITRDRSHGVRSYDAVTWTDDNYTRTVPSHSSWNSNASTAYRVSDDDNGTRLRRLDGSTDTVVHYYRSIPNRDNGSSYRSNSGHSNGHSRSR